MNTFSTTAVWQACFLALGFALSVSAAAQEAAPPTEPPVEGASGHSGFIWALGVTLNNGANYPGSDRRGTSVGHVVGLAMGRYTLSTGGGGALLDRDLERTESGVSARLVDYGRLRLTGSLRFGGGRTAGDEPRLQGLPEIRRTLRGRIGVAYDMDDHWSFRSAISQDLLGRAGGAVLNNTARYEFDLPPGTELALVAGVQLADATYMRSFFGVPTALAGVTTPLPAFRPHAGLHSAEVGLDWRQNVSHHWVLLGGVRYSQLHGDARRSPLTVKPDNYSASVGLVYRY